MPLRTAELARRFPLALVCAALLTGCPSDKPDKPPAPQPTPSVVASAAPPASASAAPVDPPPPTTPVRWDGGESLVAAHQGPWLWVERSSAGVYAEPRDARDVKIGYVLRGAKVAISADKVEGPGCPKGWYKVVSDGYLCSHVGTTDEKSPAAKYAARQPHTAEVLPYVYARNAHNGTPLYKSLPNRAQMYEYEPYLPAAKKAKEELEREKQADLEQMRAAGLGVGGASSATAKAVPIWEREENLHEVTLEDLRADSDDVLFARLMKGFYVAVDKPFNWKGRLWYKTTKGLVAPADRFWQTAGPEFRGVELDGETLRLPVAFVVSSQKTVPTYQIDPETKKRTPKGSLPRHSAHAATGKSVEIAGSAYLELVDGSWIKDSQARITSPNPRPPEVAADERWIDVDISEQSLVVFEGDRPVYATLISSGKESKIKDKDHSTPRGMWRVREKHVVSTMDGNGSAAGDMPYSIEDVPYVMYFHKSYATHAAFWHSNYGTQMSHGCVNLSPLDAKWIFFHTDPVLPAGLAGVWSKEGGKDEKSRGSWVVVHD